jgi:hypothetical protein
VRQRQAIRRNGSVRRTNGRFDSGHSFEGGLAPIAFFFGGKQLENNNRRCIRICSDVIGGTKGKSFVSWRPLLSVYTADNLLKRFTIVSRWPIDFRCIPSTAESLKNATWSLVISSQLNNVKFHTLSGYLKLSTSVV